MISPLKIKNLTFQNNLIQGPLAGISTAAFRLLTWQQSQPAFTCSEMISCKTILHNSAFSQKRFIEKLPGEGPVCYQISGNHPNEIAEATRRLTDTGADLLNLNCGCPVKKIRNKGAGSKLLANPDLLLSLLEAMRENTHLPVSVKIRVDGGSRDKHNETIANVINASGIDFVIVHGRHWTEHYETLCRHDEIKYFVQAINVPVIGNGDIACLESLKAMHQTGCAGYMIGRAGVGQPWLIRKLISDAYLNEFKLPSAKMQGEFFLQHVKNLQPLFTEDIYLLQQVRKFAKYYARAMKDKEHFTTAMIDCKNLNELEALSQQYFK